MQNSEDLCVYSSFKIEVVPRKGQYGHVALGMLFLSFAGTLWIVMENSLCDLMN